MSTEGRAVPAGARSEDVRSASDPSPSTGDAVVLVIPGQLRDLTDGRSRVIVPVPESGTLDGAFAGLRRAHPAVYDRIFTEQRELRPHVNVFVDGADIRWAGGLESSVAPGTEVVILPAVSGG